MAKFIFGRPTLSNISTPTVQVDPIINTVIEYQDRIVEVPVDRIVIQDKIVEVIKEVPVDRIVMQDKIVEVVKIQEKVVQVENKDKLNAANNEIEALTSIIDSLEDQKNIIEAKMKAAVVRHYYIIGAIIIGMGVLWLIR